MKDYQLRVIGLIVNVILTIGLLIQSVQCFLLWRESTNDPSVIRSSKASDWKTKLITAGIYSSIVINPLLVLNGLFGNYSTMLVIMVYIGFTLLLLLQLGTSLAYYRSIKSDDFPERVRLFKTPCLTCFVLFIIYFLIRVANLIMLVT